MEEKPTTIQKLRERWEVPQIPPFVFPTALSTHDLDRTNARE